MWPASYDSQPCGSAKPFVCLLRRRQAIKRSNGIVSGEYSNGGGCLVKRTRSCKVATVLALGLDPTLADFASMPGLTPDLVQAFIDSQLERIRALGHEVESCLVDSGNTAAAREIQTPTKAAQQFRSGPHQVHHL